MPDDIATTMHNNAPAIKGDETLRLLLEPITHYLSEDGVTDIFVNKPYEIIVKNHKGRKKIKAPPVSYTHLDVYKRQLLNPSSNLLPLWCCSVTCLQS